MSFDNSAVKVKQKIAKRSLTSDIYVGTRQVLHLRCRDASALLIDGFRINVWNLNIEMDSPVDMNEVKNYSGDGSWPGVHPGGSWTGRVSDS